MHMACHDYPYNRDKPLQHSDWHQPPTWLVQSITQIASHAIGIATNRPDSVVTAAADDEVAVVLQASDAPLVTV